MRITRDSGKMLAVFMSLALTVTAIAPAGVLAEETEQEAEFTGISVSGKWLNIGKSMLRIWY